MNECRYFGTRCLAPWVIKDSITTFPQSGAQVPSDVSSKPATPDICAEVRVLRDAVVRLKGELIFLEGLRASWTT